MVLGERRGSVLGGGAAENFKNLFVHGRHGGARRTANFNIFVRGGPRRGARELHNTFFVTEGTENFKNLFVPRRTRRGTRETATATSTSFVRGEDAEGRGELHNTFFVHGGTRTSKTSLSTEDTEGHGELQEPFLSRRGAGGQLEEKEFTSGYSRRGLGLVGCHDQVVAGGDGGAEEEPGVTQEEAGAVVPADGLSGAGTSSEA